MVLVADRALPRHTGRFIGRLAARLAGDGTLSDPLWKRTAMDPNIAEDPEMTTLLNEFRRP
jgi:hypothetical protein